MIERPDNFLELLDQAAQLFAPRFKARRRGSVLDGLLSAIDGDDGFVVAGFSGMFSTIRSANAFSSRSARSSQCLAARRSVDEARH